MLVACLGRTPLLFFDFLSSLSKRDDKSTFTFAKGKKGGGSMKGEKRQKKKKRLGLVIVATETKGDYQLPFLFSAARAETPSKVSPW